MQKIALVACVAIAASATVSAATRYWNVADGDFLVAASWEGNSVPVANDGVCVTNGGTIRIAANVPKLSRMDVGLLEDISNCVVQTGGTLQMGGDIVLGRGGTGRGYYHLLGGTVKMASKKSFCVSSSGYGYLVISGTGVADIRNAGRRWFDRDAHPFAARPSLGNWTVCVNRSQGEVSLVRGGLTVIFR